MSTTLVLLLASAAAGRGQRRSRGSLLLEVGIDVNFARLLGTGAGSSMNCLLDGVIICSGFVLIYHEGWVDHDSRLRVDMHLRYSCRRS